MASLKIVAVFLAALCGVIRGEVASSCDVAVQVDYPETGAPSPACLLACRDSSSALWINGVAYKRFSDLQLNFELMVKISFKSGQVTSCTLVPYLSDGQLQEESQRLQAAFDACSNRAVPTLPTTGPTTGATTPTNPEPTTIPTTSATTTQEPIATTTSEPIPTTPEPTTPEPTTPEPTTPEPTTPEPTTTTPEPTTTTTTPAPTTTTTTTTVKPTTTTTTTTTLAPITYSCPSGFTKYRDEKCYEAFSSSTTWAKALATCRIYGATLVRISSSSEYNFVTSLTKKRFWTDVNDISSEGDHVFSDYRTSAYTNWASDEPTGDRWYGWFYNGDDCVSLDPKKGMFDDDCDDKMPFVCERATIPSR